MKTHIVYINKQAVPLDPAQLIQTGGEGMVFGLRTSAVKLYHQPTAQHAAKLRHFCRSGLAARLPTPLLAPTALVDNRAGEVVGFVMPRLPDGAQPLKRLAVARFWRKHDLRTQDVVALFQQLHVTLSQLHRLGVVVGDLNDQNLFFTLPDRPGGRLHARWIDVDSYQVDAYPCPVAMPAFLDPRLYGIADFSRRPVFTTETDWYAYFVLLIRSLLGIHPFGGTHKQYKSLQARAQAGVTILDADVTYPPGARPPASLSDDLLDQLQTVFHAGQRGPFPADLLAAYAADLLTCASCGLAYPRQRAGCPACRRPTPPAPAIRAGTRRTLLQGAGYVERVRVLANGRILAITRQQTEYALHRIGIGGTRQTLPLFTGRPGYRFALWQPPGSGPLLAVNPPGGGQLLLLDVGGDAPRRLAMTETARFRDTAVFAATPHHLVRIAGSWIMRGGIRDGLFLEDPIVTAHQRQTRFWASPYAEVIAGYHRIFAEHRFWLWHGGRQWDVTLPLAAGERVRDAAVAFGPRSALFQLTIAARGRTRRAGWIVNLHGDRVPQAADKGVAMGSGPGAGAHDPFITPPSPDLMADPAVRLLRHPAGILIQDATSVTLAYTHRA